MVVRGKGVSNTSHDQNFRWWEGRGGKGFSEKRGESWGESGVKKQRGDSSFLFREGERRFVWMFFWRGR